MPWIFLTKLTARHAALSWFNNHLIYQTLPDNKTYIFKMRRQIGKYLIWVSRAFSVLSFKLFTSSRCVHQGYHFNVLLWQLWHLSFTCCPPVASSVILSPFKEFLFGLPVFTHMNALKVWQSCANHIHVVRVSKSSKLATSIAPPFGIVDIIVFLQACCLFSRACCCLVTIVSRWTLTFFLGSRKTVTQS